MILHEHVARALGAPYMSRSGVSMCICRCRWNLCVYRRILIASACALGFSCSQHKRYHQRSGKMTNKFVCDEQAAAAGVASCMGAWVVWLLCMYKAHWFTSASVVAMLRV